ncbi:MAG: CPBP family intramembrane metalloprotease [Chloroflexota bacterium]|nr:MAG: CPBP family intramembrane metalloprotease [Chloroflexota bacterium]
MMTVTEITQYPVRFAKKQLSAENLYKGGLFLIFLLCGLGLFIFGTSYYDRFASNTNGLIKIGMSASLIAAAYFLGQFEKTKPFSGLVYALFVASAVNVVTWYFALFSREKLFELLGVSLESVPGMAAAKLCEAGLAVATILLLVKARGENLASLYIRRGNLQWALRIGVLALLNLIASALIIASSIGQGVESILSNIPWFITFAFANAFMEELWFRGLFLGRLQPLFGESGALWMTSIWFGSIHILAVYVTGVAALIFGVLAFTLGLAFCLLVQKTRTIWGATIFHAAADLHWFIAFGF